MMTDSFVNTAPAALAPTATRVYPSLQGNRLLAALPEESLQSLRSLIEPAEMPLGLVLYESGGPQSHAWFPVTAIVSLQYVTESGATSEISVVGNEGMVGISLIMGGGSTSSQAVVRSAGQGFRIKGAALLGAFEQGGPLARLLLRYSQALIAQMAQTAACNRHHSINQRLCRWLLQSLDRLQGNEVTATQELVANALGVRREGITEAALALQRDGLITYRRGHLTVLDRHGLAQRSCECYQVVRREYERLLPVVFPR